eukprot:PITA_04123
MGPQGLSLNKWTPDFDPGVDVPTVVPMWVRLPNLPVHFWNWESLKHIVNTLGKFIDRENNKDQYDCARICVEVDLELPFKCRKCHVYGHFARSCSKISEVEKGKDEGWTQVKRSKNAHKVIQTGNTKGNGPQATPRNQTPIMEEQGNKFAQLSSTIEGTQEPEMQKEGLTHKESPSGSKHVESNEDRSKELLIEETEEVQGS